MSPTQTSPANGRAVLDGAAADAIAEAIRRGEIDEIEILWPDHQGHARGKRIEARGFLERAAGSGFAFCDAALTWDIAGDIKEGLRLSGWDTGYPDLYARPDLATFARLPWRTGSGQVVCDVFDHHGALIRTAPRTVLRRVVDRLAALGYRAEVGVEIEFHVLDAEGRPLFDGAHAYSLQKLNELDPVIGEILGGPARLRGPRGRQQRVRIGAGRGQPASRRPDRGRRPGEPLEVRDAGDRAPRRRDRHVHGQAVSRRVRQLDAPARVAVARRRARVRAGRRRRERAAPARDRRSARPPAGHHPLQRADRQLVQALRAALVRPHHGDLGGDNRTVAVRSLVESPAATRIELRAGAADAQPHWAVAGTLAAIVAALEADEPPSLPERGEGNRYGAGSPCRRTLAEGVAAARADAVVAEVLGVDAVHDYTTLAELEWRTFVGAVSDWDRDRYLRAALMATPHAPAATRHETPGRCCERRSSPRSRRSSPGAPGASRSGRSSPVRSRTARTPIRCRSPTRRRRSSWRPAPASPASRATSGRSPTRTAGPRAPTSSRRTRAGRSPSPLATHGTELFWTNDEGVYVLPQRDAPPERYVQLATEPERGALHATALKLADGRLDIPREPPEPVRAQPLDHEHRGLDPVHADHATSRGSASRRCCSTSTTRTATTSAIRTPARTRCARSCATDGSTTGTRSTCGTSSGGRWST